MKDTAIQFGKQVKLSGVLSEPENPNPNTPMVLILNSGVRHHVGCCRMSVKLARAIGELGFTSFRLDLSGVGDSPLRGDTMGYTESSGEEALSAMDFLQRTQGCDRFVIYGLCSGAYLGFRLAQQDSRIVGLAQVDGHVFRTPRFYLHHYLPRFFSVSAWIRFLTETMPIRLGLKQLEDERLAQESDDFVIPEWPDEPPKPIIEKGQANLLEKGTQLLCFITDALHPTYNYAEQYYDMYPSLDLRKNTAVVYMPNASHILLEHDSQETVLKEVSAWIQKHFSGTSA